MREINKNLFLKCVEINAIVKDIQNNRNIAGQCYKDATEINDKLFIEHNEDTDGSIGDLAKMFVRYEYGDYNRNSWEIEGWLKKAIESLQQVEETNGN